MEEAMWKIVIAVTAVILAAMLVKAVLDERERNIKTPMQPSPGASSSGYSWIKKKLVLDPP
jgi:hypothetical protein